MLLTLLATVQLVSTWASTLSNLDRNVNQEIQRLEASIDPIQQEVDVKDIKISMTDSYYYAFILYEISDKNRH